MKSFSIALALVLSLSSTFVFAGPPSDEQVEKARRECNSTNPVPQDPLIKMIFTTLEGKMLNLSRAEKCYITCFYHTLGLYYENSTINMEVLKDWSSVDTYSNTTIATGIILNDATRNYEDKCERGFVNIYQFFIQQLVQEEMKPPTNIEKQVKDALDNGKPIITLLNPKLKRSGFLYSPRELRERDAQQRKNSHVESPLQRQARQAEREDDLLYYMREGYAQQQKNTHDESTLLQHEADQYGAHKFSYKRREH